VELAFRLLRKSVFGFFRANFSKKVSMKNLYIFLFAFISVVCSSQVSMSFTSTPDSASQSPRPGSTGTFQIMYSGNVFNNSNVYYSICCQSSRSSALNAYRFNFNIPLSATITGVSVTYSTTGGNGGPMNYKWDSLCLSNNFLQLGTYKRDSVNGAGATFVNGSASDTWGAALTPSIVNSAHFGVRLHLDTYGINTTVLGGFKMVIHYSMPTGINVTAEEFLKPVIYARDKELYIKQHVSQSGKLALFSLTGEKVMEAPVEGQDTKLNLIALAPGIYLYKYSSAFQSVSSKIIIE
jgi:hypothetical protein